MNIQSLIEVVRRHPWIADRPTIRQFVKFGLVGALNTGVDFTVFTICVYGFRMHYLVANVAAFGVAAVNSYVLNRRWTFRNDDPRWHVQMVKFFVVLTIGFGLNELLLYFLVSRFAWSKIVAKLAVILVVLFWNYLVNRFWTFRAKAGDLRVAP